MPRQPILTVLGHVDSGKTTLLDSIRESEIVDGEAGGITQMIGATEVPLTTVEDICGGLLDRIGTELTIPGLMFIDTPGHAAFSSLRKRGGSISDIAILVVDIEEGLQPQTEEAIEILKQSETPFVIALNKVDKLSGWRSEEKCFTDSIEKQGGRQLQELDQKIYDLMAEMDEHGFVVDRFDRIDSFTDKIAVVPVSAKTGEGLPELLMTVTGLAQNYLADQLEVEPGTGKATVLEVSEQKGFGTTVDVIHYDGRIESGEYMAFGTSEGAEVTEIRAILKPRPLQEIRLDKQYQEIEESEPASGIKIAGKDLEGVIPGSPVRTGKNKEGLKREVEEELELSDYETQMEGIVVKADSLGSLEALMNEVNEIGIPVMKAEVGSVNKNDVMEAGSEDEEFRAVVAFNTDLTEEARKASIDRDVKIIQSSVIYQIVDEYENWKNQIEEEKLEKKLREVSRPAEIRTLQDHVFRSSNPVVIGMKVEKGKVTNGYLMTENGERVGKIKAVQDEGESIDLAEKGERYAISIQGATLDRDFQAGDHLYIDVPSEDYRRLEELEEHISTDEKQALDKIVEIKDRRDPHWKLE